MMLHDILSNEKGRASQVREHLSRSPTSTYRTRRREELFKTYFQPQVEGNTSDTGVMRPKVEILSVMAKNSVPVVFLVTVPYLFRKFSISSIYKSISYFRPSSSFTGRPFLTGTVPKGKLRLQPGYRTVINWCLDIKFST